MGGKRNWTIEDNVVALYIARYGHDGLNCGKKEIRSIVENTGLLKKGFHMRVDNYVAIKTKGRKGLNAGLKSPTFNKLYKLFKPIEQKRFKSIVNLILANRKTLKTICYSFI